MLRKKSGFTLVELIVALALSGIVMVTGMWLIQYFTGMNNKAGENSQAQQLARMQTEFLESELRYAYNMKIVNILPSKLDEDYACIYINDNKIWRKDPGHAGEMLPAHGFSEYDYDIKFIAESEKILRTEVRVLKKEKQLFNTHFTLFVENLDEEIEGLAEGLMLVYEKEFKPVSSISIGSDRGFLSGNGEPMQMQANISPINASNKGVIWAVEPKTHAKIDSNGMLSPLRNGLVNVKAIALDGSGVTASKEVQIRDLILANGIDIRGQNNLSSLRMNGSLQLYATVSPINAANKEVKWEVITNYNFASIDENGLLRANVAPFPYSVEVRATATDGSNVYSTRKLIVNY